MQIESDGIVNGKILDKYGKRGLDNRFGMPTHSLPIKIIDKPEGTKSFAIIMEDPDSIHVCNKVWTHWLVANLYNDYVEEDSSSNGATYMQGVNSWNDNSYGGPCPPNAPHKYVITCYALDSSLPLRGGFTKELLLKSMEGKILATAKLEGVYDALVC